MAILRERETSTGIISFNQSEGNKVGRLDIPMVGIIERWQPSPTYLQFFNALNGGQPNMADSAATLRRSLSFSLNNNTLNTKSPIRHERGASAYFSTDLVGEKVIIEWGLVNPVDGEAKLHKYLNIAVDYDARVKEGMRLTSGHIARISAEEEIYLAFLDSLSANDRTITRLDPRGRLINALYAANFIPITAEGFVRLPVFV